MAALAERVALAREEKRLRPQEAIDVDGDRRCRDLSDGPRVPVPSDARIEQRDAVARQEFV